jgi:hypothetical protein
MTADSILSRKHSDLIDGFESPLSPTGQNAARNNPLSVKATSVLSAPYADSDIRDALDILDKRGVENNAETRRQLRLDVQREVIESNGEIIREFGHVAEVCKLSHMEGRCVNTNISCSSLNVLASPLRASARAVKK